jgi:DNA-directed RNA polymerase subunit RPC12/RpoP
MAHKKKFHVDDLKINFFACDFCDEKFLYKGSLKTHLEKFQCRIQKVFTCNHCGKEFDSKRQIREHDQIHAKLKVECKICHVQVIGRSLESC